MPKTPPSHYPDIGDIGEDLVAEWLKSTGWNILERRFSCRWGEIDIIAEYNDPKEPTLVFVEVKTRSRGSWDAGGRNAITAKKQAKICQTAEIFLVQYPEKADYSCRFDVALVFSQRYSHQQQKISMSKSLATLSKNGYSLKLLDYIPAAFDMSIIN